MKIVSENRFSEETNFYIIASDYEPERKPRKRSAAAAATLRKPKTEENDEEDGGDDGCDSKSAAKVIDRYS